MPWPKVKPSKREEMPDRCFLFPVAKKFVVCKPRRPYRTTCEGALSARRRAILNKDMEAEKRAISLARDLGCPWGAAAVAKRRGKRRSRKA